MERIKYDGKETEAQLIAWINSLPPAPMPFKGEPSNRGTWDKAYKDWQDGTIDRGEFMEETGTKARGRDGIKHYLRDFARHRERFATLDIVDMQTTTEQEPPVTEPTPPQNGGEEVKMEATSALVVDTQTTTEQESQDQRAEIDALKEKLAAAIIERDEARRELAELRRQVKGVKFKGWGGNGRRHKWEEGEQQEIITRRRRGESINTIAREMKISNRVISRVVKSINTTL